MPRRPPSSRAEAARRLGVDATQLWIEAQQLQGARARGRRPEPLSQSGHGSGESDSWPPPSFAERDLLALLLHVDEARAELLPVLEDEDVAHPGLRRLLDRPAARARRAAGGIDGRPAGAIAERGLLAALLVEDRQWGDTHSHVAELKRRYHIRHRKHRVRQVERAVALAQAIGDPALPALEEEPRAAA